MPTTMPKTMGGRLVAQTLLLWARLTAQREAIWRK